MQLFDGDGNPVRLSKALGRGGEGEVWAVDSQTVAKVLIAERRTDGKFQKIKAMVDRRPEGADALVDGFPVLTWPQQVLYSSGTRRELSTFVGYSMIRIAERDFVPFFKITSAGRRRQLGGAPVTWDRMVLLAARICHLVRTLHRFGYAVGDLNDRNLLISRKFTPLLMDTDSFQVPRGVRGHFPSTVGDQLYWPPELLGVDLKDNKKSRLHGDRYALATLLFQLFMNGNRPYQARGAQVDELESLMAKTRAGHFPWAKPVAGQLEPPASAPNFNNLPKPLRRAFLRCFVAGHKQPWRRPSAHDWYRILIRQAGRGFSQCEAASEHVYSSANKMCPWCGDANDAFATVKQRRGRPVPVAPTATAAKFERVDVVGIDAKVPTVTKRRVILAAWYLSVILGLCSGIAWMSLLDDSIVKIVVSATAIIALVIAPAVAWAYSSWPITKPYFALVMLWVIIAASLAAVLLNQVGRANFALIAAVGIAAVASTWFVAIERRSGRIRHPNMRSGLTLAATASAANLPAAVIFAVSRLA